jgi:lipoprotein-anchoring transpeptidase ErfK/SrfK
VALNAPRWIISALSLLALAILGTGCASAPRQAGNLPPVDHISYWKGDDMTGKPSIRIELGKQRAYFYKGGQLAGLSIISSGKAGFDTVTGSFRIIEKDKDHRSSIFGDYVDAITGAYVQRNVDTRKDPMPKGAIYVGAPMPYFMRIVGGTGMHEGFLPGYPASHGCIRLPEAMAAAFFDATPLGTPVVIEP